MALSAMSPLLSYASGLLMLQTPSPHWGLASPLLLGTHQRETDDEHRRGPDPGDYLRLEGLVLPDAPPGVSHTVTDDDVPRQWTVARGESDMAAVLFHFPPPLDNMTGVVTAVHGRLSLGPGPGIGGVFLVRVSNLTTGDEMLDDTVHGVSTLDADTYPESSFRVERIEGDLESLRFGIVTQAMMHGTFQLKDRLIPLTVRTTFEPVIDTQGLPRLLLTADWSLRLKGPFGLLGPDGPHPANDTLLLRCNVTLEPDQTKRQKEKHP